MGNEYNFSDLAGEYADLVIASEHGIDRFGDPANGNEQREIEIERICESQGNGDHLLLNQAVINYLEELGL